MTEVTPVASNLYKERISQLVSEILEIDVAELTDTSLFKEDHGADSLRAIEILASLEREFRIEIDQAELARMVNLQGICDVVSEAAGWGEES
jgi:acyl carrier protein